MKGIKAILILVTWCVVAAPIALFAQSIPVEQKDSSEDVKTNNSPFFGDSFRAEKVIVAGGSEIVTIFMRKKDSQNLEGDTSDLPLVSVLRDTLGDERIENDRLRYVWLHAYPNPAWTQKITAAIPFLYFRTTNKDKVGSEPPPAIIDLQKSDKIVWNKVLWVLFKRLLAAEFGLRVTAPTLQYRQNRRDYQRAAIATAMVVLSLYQNTEGEKLFSERELKDIQARLSLTDKTFGWHMQSENLDRVYEKEIAMVRDYRGHNWELLRQMAESQGLFFEPLLMPDGSARHAIVWISTDDIVANKGKKFDGRFLNIKNPWRDDKLRDWKGYRQSRWFDSDDRQVEPNTPGAIKRTLIPLALYGLDHPKIPVILIDFRNSENPKVREISKRLLADVTGNVVNLTALNGLAFALGRYVYEFITGRRGIDLNQSSRLRSIAQLKFLLSLENTIDPELRNELAKRIESVSLNPLENNVEAQKNFARKQYQNLLDYARDPNGLPAKIRSDRREEMSRFAHGKLARTFFALGRILSFGIYAHREDDTPEMTANIDIRRQLDFYERLLRETAIASHRPEIDADIEKLKQALAFVSTRGSGASEKTTKAIARIFAITSDEDLRSLCLASLYRIDNKLAKRELLAIYRDEKIPTRWREICAKYLRLALEEGQRMSSRDIQLISTITASN